MEKVLIALTGHLSPSAFSFSLLARHLLSPAPLSSSDLSFREVLFLFSQGTYSHRLRSLTDSVSEFPARHGLATSAEAWPLLSNSYRLRSLTGSVSEFPPRHGLAISAENTCRKLPALYYGPEENSQVSKYKMVQEQFPVSLRKQPWSNTEREKLAKGIKQQYQEMLMRNLINADSNIEGLNGSDLMPALCSSDLEAPPEKIRSFLPLVNWDRLAIMYLPDRSGEECEARET